MKKDYCNELIEKLQLIKQNRCSLSDEDLRVIDEVIVLLKVLLTEDENDKPNFGDGLTIAKAIALLIQFFLGD